MTKGNKPAAEKPIKAFDMYRFFSRKDVILVVAFIIAFLVFSLAILLYPQAA